MEVNKSKRVQTAGDENADGWLCARKKMKGSSPALKMPGQRRRHFPRSPLVSLMNESSPQMKLASSKQTSILKFFNPPRLQPFPSSQNEATTGTSLLAPSVSESQSQQSSEDCSAPCFPKLSPEGISPGALERVSSPYSASLHDATRHFPSAAERVTSSHDENEKLEASGVSQTKSLPAKMKRKSDCPPGSVGECSSQYEFCFPEKQNASDESICDTENILPWLQGETEESTLPENTGIAGRQHQEVITFPDSLQTPEFLQDILSGMDVDEPTLLEFPGREVLKSKSVDGSPESPRPDCQCQITKEKSSLELDTYQNSPRSGSDEEKIYNINESGDCSPDSATSDSWQRKKENKSSLKVNTYHCNSSPDSARSGSWQRKKENKSSLEVNTYHCSNFSSSPNSSGEETLTESTNFSCLETEGKEKSQVLDQDSFQSLTRKQKRHTASFSARMSKIVIDDLQTPEFLKDFYSMDSCSSVPESTAMQFSGDLQTPDFLST